MSRPRNRWRPALRGSPADLSGQTTVLIVGFAVILLMLTGVVVDSSAAYLKRQELDTLADGAALAAADQARGEAIYSGGVDDHVPISVEGARAGVSAHLRRVGAWSEHPGLRVETRVVGDAVVVRLELPLDLPFRVGEIGTTTVGATGSAEVRVDAP
jgi:uncharacterized membrane protein